MATNCAHRIHADGSHYADKTQARDFERHVLTVIEYIRRSEAGRAMVDAIGATEHQMVISPYRKEDWTPPLNECNAYAQAERIHRAIPVGDAIIAPDGVAWLGAGGGSDCIVRFIPAHWGHGAACPAGDEGAPGSTPSELLLHEMLHGYRMMRGTFSQRKTLGKLALYDDEDEFFSIVLTNVYTTDPSNPNGLRMPRADHIGFKPLPLDQWSSVGFVSAPENRRLLERQLAEEPSLMRRLKDVQSGFNPIREALLYAIAKGACPSQLVPVAYVDTADQVRRVRQQVSAMAAGGPPPEGSTPHTVAAGDTLSGIAKRFYGDPAKWPVIYAANEKAIGADPDRVAAGTALVVPALPKRQLGPWNVVY